MGERGQEKRARIGQDGGMSGEIETELVERDLDGDKMKERKMEEMRMWKICNKKEEFEGNRHRDRGYGWILAPSFTNT